MTEQQGGISTSKAALWFGLSVVIALINFSSALRPGGFRWLALGLGVFSVFIAVRYGRVLLARYLASKSRGRG